MVTYAEKYLQDFEKRIEKLVLSCSSLYYCNNLYIDSLRSDCTYEISGLPYDMHEAKYKFSEEQKLKLDTLLGACKLRCRQLLGEKGFEISPTAVIDEICDFYEKNQTNSNLVPAKIFLYFAYLVRLLLDSDGKPSALNEEQKGKILSIYFGYSYRYGNGEYFPKSFAFNSPSELINVVESFYNSKLKTVKEIDDLNDEQTKNNFKYLYENLNLFVKSDFLHGCVDAESLEKINMLYSIYKELR